MLHQKILILWKFGVLTLEEPPGGEQKKIDEDNQLEISKDLEEVHATVSGQK